MTFLTHRSRTELKFTAWLLPHTRPAAKKAEGCLNHELVEAHTHTHTRTLKRTLKRTRQRHFNQASN